MTFFYSIYRLRFSFSFRETSLFEPWAIKFTNHWANFVKKWVLILISPPVIWHVITLVAKTVWPHNLWLLLYGWTFVFSEAICLCIVPTSEHILYLFSISNSIISRSEIFGHIKTYWILCWSICSCCRWVALFYGQFLRENTVNFCGKTWYIFHHRNLEL